MKELEIMCLYCDITDNEYGFLDYNEEDEVGICNACASEIEEMLEND